MATFQLAAVLGFLCVTGPGSDIVPEASSLNRARNSRARDSATREEKEE
jgi:hypothetical protein